MTSLEKRFAFRLGLLVAEIVARYLLVGWRSRAAGSIEDLHDALLVFGLCRESEQHPSEGWKLFHIRLLQKEMIGSLLTISIDLPLAVRNHLHDYLCHFVVPLFE